jgi:hypothetical protein
MTNGLYHGSRRISLNGTNDPLLNAFISVIERNDKQVILDPVRTDYSLNANTGDATFVRCLTHFTAERSSGHLLIQFDDYFRFIPWVPGEVGFYPRGEELQRSETSINYVRPTAGTAGITVVHDLKGRVINVTFPFQNHRDQARIFGDIPPKDGDLFSALPRLERLLDVYLSPEKYFS